MSDNNQYYFYPYLRKGLNSHISETDRLGAAASGEARSRGTVKMAVELKLAKSGGSPVRKTYEKVFELFGPGDVSGISESAVMQTVPSDGDNGYCNDYLAAIEFFEEDLPWRYTPLSANQERLRPWLSLILCKDDEFTEETAGSGTKVVRLNLNADNYSQVLPKPSDCHLYAHVQLIHPTADIDSFLEEDPDAGISRIFCPRKIEGGPLASQHVHYTAFLIPSFEIGRRKGLGQGVDGVDIQQHAWPEKFADASPDNLVFPVYYQWSFSSGGDRFCDLANKLRPVTSKENAGFAPFITADINDCGLDAYTVDAQTDPDKLMDPIGVPVACVKLGFNEADVEKNNSESMEMRKWMKEKLLDKSPVFYENKLVLEKSGEVANMDEDPWVVPPIYGAKQALTTELGWNSSKQPKDWVSEQNLMLRHRIAGGLGKKVVQKNQEDFVQRAWLQVEQINELNQTMRERLSGIKLDNAARKQFDEDFEQKKKDNKSSSTTSGFSTDSFVRTLHLANQSGLNAEDVIKGHLDVIESYAKGDCRNASSVSEDFIESLLKDNEDASLIMQKYAVQLAATNPVIMVAAGVANAYKKVSPASALLYSMFDVHLNGLKVDIQTGTHSTPYGTPFEFYTTSETLNVYRGCKINNHSYQIILAWLTGFDNYPGDKDYYDDDCDCHTMRLRIDYYNKFQIAPPERYETQELSPGSYTLGFNVLPYRVHITGSDAQGFVLPDPTYRRFFGSLIDGEKNKLGIGVKYTLGPKKQAKEMTVYFFPVSATKRAIRKLVPQSTLTPNKEGRCSDHEVNLETEYYIGELSNCIVSDSVSKNYDFRQNWDQADLQVNRGDHCFVLPPTNQPHIPKTRFFSRYWTICQLISELEGFNFPNPVVYGIKMTYMSKKTGQEFICCGAPSKHNGWMCLTTPHWVKTPDGKSYNTHKIVFHDCLALGLMRKEGKTYYYDFERILQELKTTRDAIDTFVNNVYLPDSFEFTPASIPNIEPYDAWTLIDGDGQLDKMAKQSKDFWELLKKESDLWKTFDKVPDKPQTPAPPRATEEDAPLIDPSEEATKKLTSILEKYYGSGKTVDIEKLLRSKYPVMAYPEYPDPTYFYLRELSERFILPSAGELPANSISLFMSNAKFEEAFLSGMNTEMGRELLWREYPTDERGSYFRKFWDSEEDPTDDSYWDVERMDEWKGRLGDNHAAGKGALLIFAIKGELLQCYPQTFIYLTRKPEERNLGDTVILPAMTSWLSGDTFIAGFRAADLPGKTDQARIQGLRDNGYYLALQERDASMHFDYLPDSNYAAAGAQSGSAGWASSRLHQPAVWAMPCKNAINL